MLKKFLFILTLLSFALAACSGGASSTPSTGGNPSSTSSTAGAGDPVKTVEKYLQAKVAGDAKTVQQLLCAAMEKQAEQEATTFLGTDQPKIEDMACSAIATDKVKCSGKITALYGQEKNEFPLVTYKVTQEDGEWKYCGETQ
jgi:hypothetical protein